MEPDVGEVNFCICGHTEAQHSCIDERQWCAYRCPCTEYELATSIEDVAEAAARQAMERFQEDLRRARRRWEWEPDEGDRAWSEQKDAWAKGRTGK